MNTVTALFGVPEIERIVQFARKYPVFPCAQDKRPRTKRGFHDASQDPEQVRSWWTRWPDSLVGVPTGQITGIVAIDYDPDKATNATHKWLAEHTDLLTSTRVHTTARGGKHYLFRSTDRFQTGTDLVLDGSPRRGLDLRASGGYVIWWPAHLGGTDDTSIAPLPSGLIDERAFDRKRDMAELPPAPVEWTREHDKVREALSFLHPDGYEHWIRIGMAIHHASGGSDEGFALWHDWSARGESYDGIEDCRYHWASFGGYEGRALGVGTIYAQAKAHGFNPIRVELPPLEVYAEEAGDKPPPVVLRHISEIVAEQREPEWLVDDVIEANVLAVLAGPRSTFKSFVALDWSMRIALSGRAVVILSGEGAGLDRRVDAWMRTHCPTRAIEKMPVYALERAMNLNQDVDMVLLKGAIERIGQTPCLVVVDTFSKFSAGLDENDNGEVSTYLARLSVAIREAFGASVLLVAHSGHTDSARPRGASALMANPDAEYIITRPAPTGMQITVSRERFKDCPSLEPMGYEAQVVDLGRLDKRGRAVTSLALISAEPVIVTPSKRGGANQERALVALREFHRANPEVRFLSSMDLFALLKAQGIGDRRRRPEVISYLVTTGILTNSVGGHVFDPTNL